MIQDSTLGRHSRLLLARIQNGRWTGFPPNTRGNDEADIYFGSSRITVIYALGSCWGIEARTDGLPSDTSGQTAAERHDHANPRWAYISCLAPNAIPGRAPGM